MHKIAIPERARSSGRLVLNFGAVDWRRAALLVVDLQNAFVDPDYPTALTAAREIIPNVNAIAEAMRVKGATVIFLRHSHSDTPPFAMAPWQRNVDPKITALREAVRPGAPGHEIYSALDRGDEDLVVDKYRNSALIQGSSLLGVKLEDRGIDTLVITGAATNICCESTARDAFMLGYRVYFIADATVARGDDEHNAALLSLASYFADVRLTSEFLGVLNAPGYAS